MYLVGFYSPMEKSGVTETSLLIYEWLKTNTSLSIAFISYHKLQKETIMEGLIDEFGSLNVSEQRKTMKKLNKAYDIVIFDGSSGLSKKNFHLLAHLDRLFILGEENVQFAQTLHRMLQFYKSFDPNTKSLSDKLADTTTFILGSKKEQKIGFSESKKNIEETAKIIYNDYVTFYVEKDYESQYKKLLNELKSAKREEIRETAYKLGLSFEKSCIFEKYLFLRVALGQSFTEALEDTFLICLENPYEHIFQTFQNELQIAQINFGKGK